MDISGYSDYGKENLMKKYEPLRMLPVEELAMRIAVALDVQDSCDACWVETMRNTMVYGECALWTCDKCTEEIEKQL